MPSIDEIKTKTTLPFFTIEPPKKIDLSQAPVILIHGFLTENNESERHFFESLPIGGNLYELSWKSCSVKKLLHSGISLFSSSLMLRSGTRSLGLLGLSSDLLQNPWYQAIQEAEKVGESLAKLIIESQRTDFILIGHSLGARVIYAALHYLAKWRPKSVDSVYLFGGAVNCAASKWEAVSGAVKTQIHNFYSKNDNVLKYGYQGSRFSRPIGYYPIGSRNLKIIDHDVSKWVDKHTDYKPNLNQLFSIALGLPAKK